MPGFLPSTMYVQNIKETSVVAEYVFPVLNVWFFYLGREDDFLHINNKMLWRCCQDDMAAKGEYVSRVRGSCYERGTGTT
jgi:hypothetical protein